MSISDNTKKKRHINGGKKEKDTFMYKKQYKQDKQYINIPRECEEVCNQWVKQMSMG